MEQQVEFAKRPLSFKVGTGKDARIFIKFIVDEEGEKNIYNIPLLTLNSLQVFTSRPKVPRYTFGSASPKGLSIGIKNVSGFITAVTPNQSLGKVIREKMKGYQPISANELNLDTDGIITIEELDKLRYLDQLPPCQINIYITHPDTKKVFSKAIYGVVFSNESHSIGGSEAMAEQYSFAAAETGPIRHEEVSDTK
ncbi:MAG: hypothetical protein ACRCX2_28765 [Paraclostridium sp.]